MVAECILLGLGVGIVVIWRQLAPQAALEHAGGARTGTDS
jgi:hypothetical protein